MIRFASLIPLIRMTASSMRSRDASNLLALLFTSLLTACATVGERTAEEDSPESVLATAEATPRVETTPPALPPPEEIEYGSFSEDILTRVIIAEMAGQRGYNQKALADYLELARETNDINIIKRASRIASFLRDVQAAIEMGNMWLPRNRVLSPATCCPSLLRPGHRAGRRRCVRRA